MNANASRHKAGRHFGIIAYGYIKNRISFFPCGLCGNGAFGRTHYHHPGKGKAVPEKVSCTDGIGGTCALDAWNAAIGHWPCTVDQHGLMNCIPFLGYCPIHDGRDDICVHFR